MCWPLPSDLVIDWPLWVQFVGYIIWPVVAIVAMAFFGGPIRRFFERTSKVSAAGVTLEALTAKVDAIEDDQASYPTSTESVELPIVQPTAPETITENQAKLEPGWKAIIDALDRAFKAIEQQRPMDTPKLARTYFQQRKFVLCINQLVLTRWMSFELRDVLKSLHELRERAVTGQLNNDEVAIFGRNATKSAVSISNAINYRLLRATTQPVQPSQ